MSDILSYLKDSIEGYQITSFEDEIMKDYYFENKYKLKTDGANKIVYLDGKDVTWPTEAELKEELNKIANKYKHGDELIFDINSIQSDGTPVFKDADAIAKYPRLYLEFMIEFFQLALRSIKTEIISAINMFVTQGVFKEKYSKKYGCNIKYVDRHLLVKKLEKEFKEDLKKNIYNKKKFYENVNMMTTMPIMSSFLDHNPGLLNPKLFDNYKIQDETISSINSDIIKLSQLSGGNYPTLKLSHALTNCRFNLKNSHLGGGSDNVTSCSLLEEYFNHLLSILASSGYTLEEKDKENITRRIKDLCNEQKKIQKMIIGATHIDENSKGEIDKNLLLNKYEESFEKAVEKYKSKEEFVTNVINVLRGKVQVPFYR